MKQYASSTCASGEVATLSSHPPDPTGTQKGHLPVALALGHREGGAGPASGSKQATLGDPGPEPRATFMPRPHLVLFVCLRFRFYYYISKTLIANTCVSLHDRDIRSLYSHYLTTTLGVKYYYYLVLQMGKPRCREAK